MLLTATTLKDSRSNVERFVTGNLASGVDHLVVFVDDPRADEQAEVAAYLEGHPHVTAVRCDKTWWRGDRPRNLNVRQRINANVVLRAAAATGAVDWVAHVDGDEIVRVDPGVLDALPADVPAVHLGVLETVSSADATEPPTRFKRLLTDEELNLIHVLGVIADPSNQTYFHGHVMGKSLVRPASGLRLTLHHAVDDRGRRVERHEDPALSVLHYDAWSGEEFVRKWTTILGAGPVRYRSDRGTTASALRTLVGRDLSPEVARTYLWRIFELTTADDITTLDDLGLLVEADPLAGIHSPVSAPQAVDALERAIVDLADTGLRAFEVDTERRGSAAEGGDRRSRARSLADRILNG